jgi:hypothetical protein
MSAHHDVIINNVIGTEQVLCAGSNEVPVPVAAAPLPALYGNLGRRNPENPPAVYEDANVRVADLRTLYAFRQPRCP